MRSGSEVRSRRSVSIHPTAIIHPEAELGEDVSVGPYSIIAGTVKIGDGTSIGSHCVIEGNTAIGKENEIFTGAVIGSRTQDKKYDGGTSYLMIGDGNRIREYATVNCGTDDGSHTVVGNDNLLMAYSHVAHDCVVHNHVVLANQATLAGHVIIDDRAIVGGLSAVHQFVRIGELSLIGGCSKVVQDVPPFMMADGHPVRVYGINTVGLERAGISKDERTVLKKAFKIIFKSKQTLKSAIRQLETDDLPITPSLEVLLKFLKTSERGICR